MIINNKNRKNIEKTGLKYENPPCFSILFEPDGDQKVLRRCNGVGAKWLRSDVGNHEKASCQTEEKISNERIFE